MVRVFLDPFIDFFRFMVEASQLDEPKKSPALIESAFQLYLGFTLGGVKVPCNCRELVLEVAPKQRYEHA